MTKRVKTRQFNFNEEMEKDLEYIRNTFKEKFRVMPNNTQILNLLLQTYKESKVNVSQQPRKRKQFVIRL